MEQPPKQNLLKRTALFLYEHQLAKAEEEIRKQTKTSALHRLPITFNGTYEQLLSLILSSDPKEVLPEERNALYGRIIIRDLNQVHPNFFFGGFRNNGSFDIHAFLTHSGILRRNLGQKIAQASYSNFGQGVVSVENEFYYPHINGTVEELNQKTKMRYVTIK